MNEADDDKLIAAASGLATEITPERDLWPGIEEAINRPKRSRWTPMLAQAAAVVLLVGASSMVTYVGVKYDDSSQSPAVPVVVPSNLVFEQAAFGAGEGRTFASVYRRAGGNVIKQLDRELANLSPEARADIERNLAVIRQAIANISQALEKEPNNEFLQKLLVEAYGNELAMMNRVGNMTQRVMARKDI